jgi:hypothetical protein
MRQIFRKLKSYFSGVHRSRSSAASRRTRQYRPTLETLDDRIMPSITYHGGPLLSHVEVHNVFYGQSWTSYDSWGLMRYSLDKFQSDITQSPYMAMLGEYGVGRGQFGGYDQTNDALGGSVNESQIQGMLTREILSGNVPWETGQQLYFVYLPPNVRSAWDQANSTVGHHGSFVLPLWPYNSTVYYAVITHPTGNTGFSSSLNVFQNLTEVSSHELAEAVTDPDIRQVNTNTDWTNSHLGWIDRDQYLVTWYWWGPSVTPNPNFNSEIGDMVNWQYTNFVAKGTTYTVQKEWSNYYGGGIIANGNQAYMLDFPPNPALFTYLTSTTWNNGGRTTTEYYAVGTDGRIYLDFVTAAGDLSGWFTVS